MSDLAKARGLELLLAAMPVLETEIEAIKAAVITRVKQDKRDGKLTPDAAQAYWAEWLAADALIRVFHQRIRTYQGASTRVAPLLTGTAPTM